MYNKMICATLLMLLGISAVGSVLIDQSQTNSTFTSDLSSYGNSGQTFTPGMDGQLIGIRLKIEGRGYTGGPYGSDFRVDLHQVSASNVVNPQVLVSGTRQKTGILRLQPQWFEIMFDSPYQQTKGQKLAFTIFELSGGGSNGWNQYGMSSGNVYTGGQWFGSYTTSPLTASNTDFAFETILIPEPATMLLLTIGWIVRQSGLKVKN
jgi:hypothetical protein